MAEIINGVPIGDLPGIESVPDDSMLVVEFLGKAYHMPGAVLRQMIQDVLDSMGDSVDDVTEARLTAAIETVLSSGKYNGVSPSVEVLDEDDGTTVIHIIDAFGDKRYPVEVNGARNAVQYVEQELTDAQKAQARKNIGVGDGAGTADAVQYVPQTLTTEQQTQARNNIGIPEFTSGLMVIVNPNYDLTSQHVMMDWGHVFADGTRFDNRFEFDVPYSAYELARRNGYTKDELTFYKEMSSNLGNPKADSLKIDSDTGTLMLLSAGEPIGEAVTLPTGSADDSKIFIADLNTSTYEDIKAADDAGKICYALWGGYTACMLTTLSPESAIFTTLLDPHLGLYVKFTKGTVGVSDFGLTESHSVLYEPQSLTDAQKAQARENIGALSADDIDVDSIGSNVFVGNYDTVTFTEIKTAHDAGKVCFLNLDGLMLPLLYLGDTEAVFVREVNDTTDYKVTVTSAGGKDVTLVDKNTPIYVAQSLSDAQKAQARKNIGAGEPVVDTVTSQLRKEFAVGYSEEEISNVTEWQTATSPSGFNARQRSCCYGNGYYVIAGTSGQMAYRTKETAWVKPAAFTSGVITGLAYGNGRFLAVDSNGGVFTAATPDATWEQVFTASGVIESVRYLNNRFVAVGDNGFFATSLDGKEWTQKTAFTTNTLIDSAYGDGWFIAVGASGSIFRSINLNDWLDVSIADFGDIRTALFTVNGFVIGGAGGKIAYSTDGKSWSMATNNTTSTVNWIRGFAYAEKRIYAVMYISTGGGEIWVSKDGGATWAVDRSVSGRLWCVAHGDGVFFTSGDGGAIYEMDLGIKWQNEEPDENAWYRFVATLSNGERIVSESYKSKGEKQKAVLYEAQELTDVQKAQARANIGALSTADVDTVLQQAKDSGQFDGKDGEDGYTPVKGKDYFDGANGKTAYAYAQDGGYTGTQAEFAAKLASSEKVFIADPKTTTFEEIEAAVDAGKVCYSFVGGMDTPAILTTIYNNIAYFTCMQDPHSGYELQFTAGKAGASYDFIDSNAVLYESQKLSATEQAQARTNIGALGTGGGTITGALSINDKLTQGSPSVDASVASMNRFHSDLFVQGNGTAPNTPTVAGFYLGKSTSDENRHMDIVSGGDYSYIDFNKAGRGADFDARLLVNVSSGWTDFTWGSHGDITQRVFNVNGSLRQNGTEVLTWGNAGTDSILPVRLRTYQDHNNAVSDPNLATETGFYYVNTATNRPPFSQSTHVDYRVLTTAYSDQWLQQIATDFRCGDMFLRRRENGAWTPWVRFATAGDLSGYLPLGGGLLGGSLKFQASSLPQKSLEFVCGIDSFANGGEMGWQSKAEFLNGYALKSDIPTNYAKLKTYNDFVHDGNEITMVPDGYSQGSLYFNYRTGAGQQNGNINNYLFCNGKGSTAGVTLTADAFSGTAARATADASGNNIANTYAKVTTANDYNGEQRFKNASYCPTITDTAPGIGCAFKSSRGLVNELLADKIIATASTGKIPFYSYTGASNGSMTGLTEFAYLSPGAFILRPPSGEGGQIQLEAAANDPTNTGICIDTAGGNFRIFGLQSADGVTTTGYGSVLAIHPYAKVITGGYSFDGLAARSTADGNGRNIVSTYATKNEVVTAANGALRVNLSGNASSGYKIDKTFSQIQSAWNAGRKVYLYNGGNVFNLSYMQEDFMALFTSIILSNNSVTIQTAMILESDSSVFSFETKTL